ncbi:cytosine permease [Streptomyces sp. NPDC051976]|uniref:purine-cytosine permease family protein n=1 Tax=Streptomyces sp. NPDC051976 TaxID=3154947 RepID=UPI00341CFF74
MSTSQQPRVTGLETRSIDYVPLAERHGKLWHLGPLWFMSNAQIATLAVGLTSITAGGNLIWSLIAIVTGTLLGTFFMAFHSAQGPQLGLPQMIQSRPQFGYVGALLVWLFAYVQYAGFNVFNSILAGQAMHSTAHGGVKWWVAAITVLAFVIALVGYDVIHRAEQFLTYTFLAVFGVFTVGVLCTLHYPAGSFNLGGFKWTPFLAQFGVVAGYQISWAIYVSDYSRYLPPDVTVRKTFYWTYFGSALGGAWLMVLGALLAAWAGPKDFDTISAINAAGDKVFSGFGAIVLIFAALGLVSVTALNMYGGSLTLISAADSFRKIRPTLSVRVVTIGLTAALSLVGALAATSHFLENFNNFLLLVLYLFIPWTAVNLMDYYVVRRGHYAIAEIFNPHGLYGRWGWRGIISYLVGFAAMIPFFAVGTLYTGPAAHALDGADISLFIGLPISGLLYWWLARTIDLDAEIALAAAEAKEVEPSL